MRLVKTDLEMIHRKNVWRSDAEKIELFRIKNMPRYKVVKLRSRLLQRYNELKEIRFNFFLPENKRILAEKEGLKIVEKLQDIEFMHK